MALSTSVQDPTALSTSTSVQGGSINKTVVKNDYLYPVLAVVGIVIFMYVVRRK